MAFKSPAEIVATTIASGKNKIQLSIGKLILLGFLAGSYIALGGLLAIIVGGGIPAIKAENPGLQKLLFAGVFPVGLMLVVIAGAELFTGNTATLIPPLLSKTISWKGLLKNWGVVYISNFVGALFVAWAFAYGGKVFAQDPWLSSVKSIAVAKVSLDFTTLFLKAVACNWLVCLAVWMAIAADDIAGKIIAIWFPIMAFVAMGFEHSIANMFFIPAGMFYGASVNLQQFLIGNLLPVTLGNIVGGAVFVGMGYWFVYGERT
ncbi:MAG: formate/nitrite transporter family protein [bacterium]